MKNCKKLKDAFGLNELGMIDVPVKMSGIGFSRILYGEFMGCSRCFPHGYETINAKHNKYQRNWKKYRKLKWKIYKNNQVL